MTCVVVGASQGGVGALRQIISRLPSDFPAPILICQHIGAARSFLPAILTESGELFASHAKNGEAIKPGHIYVAPPDYHLLVLPGRVELSHGPRENWARPAIDPLFRSAAESYGAGVIGVILTGRLNDGTAGLYEIKRRGGTAIVQDPASAEASGMPSSAVENVPVDFCLALSEIPDLLTRLATEKARMKEAEPDSGVLVMPTSENTIGRPVAQTCPECGGAMDEERLGNLTRFRCHIGHVMTAEVLAAAQLEALEKDISSALRMLNERAELCRDIASRHETLGDLAARDLWLQAGEEAAAREQLVRAMAESDWLHPEDRGEKAMPQEDVMRSSRQKNG